LGGPATAAELNLPYGLSFDSVGNLYIADADGYRIRMVNTSGYMSTVAGNGTWGYAGDGGPATSAALNGASTVDFGSSTGTLYISGILFSQ
jgi:hypothetical protein